MADLDSITLAQVKRLHVEPGDVVVLTLPEDYCDEDEIAEIADGLNRVLPEGVNTLILADGAEIGVLASVDGRRIAGHLDEAA